MNEQTCILPELGKLIKLLEEDKNIVWYMRCPLVEGSIVSKKYLKDQVKKFRAKQKEKYRGL